MSVPLDLSLISQLLTEQKTEGDLNALTKPGFFYVINPTNKPNDVIGWAHVINLVNDSGDDHTEVDMRIFQLYINDNQSENTVWYRKYTGEWSAWVRVARDDGIAYATMSQVTAEVTRILTTAEF